MFTLGDILEVNNSIFLINGITENSINLFVIYGLFEIEIDKTTLKMISIKKKSTNEKIPDSHFPLKSYNLSYCIEQSSFLSFKAEEIKIKGNINNDVDLREEIKNLFFSLLFENILKKDDLQNGFLKLNEMIIFSKSLNTFEPIQYVKKHNYEVGDVFFDNLIVSDFYTVDIKDINKKNLLNKNELNKNPWIVILKITGGFLSMHLETGMLFLFDFEGNATHYINDIDNRFCYPEGSYHMVKNALEIFSDNREYIDSNKNKPYNEQKFPYKIIKINEHSYFSKLKLIEKSETMTTKQITAIVLLLFKKIENSFFKYNWVRNHSLEDIFWHVQNELKNNLINNNKINEQSSGFLYNNIDFYRKHCNTKIYYLPEYDRYSFEQYKSKILFIVKMFFDKKLDVNFNNFINEYYIDNVLYNYHTPVEKTYNFLVELFKKINSYHINGVTEKYNGNVHTYKPYWLSKFYIEWNEIVYKEVFSKLPLNKTKEEIFKDISFIK